MSQSSCYDGGQSHSHTFPQHTFFECRQCRRSRFGRAPAHAWCSYPLRLCNGQVRLCSWMRCLQGKRRRCSRTDDDPVERFSRGRCSLRHILLNIEHPSTQLLCRIVLLGTAFLLHLCFQMGSSGPFCMACIHLHSVGQTQSLRVQQDMACSHRHCDIFQENTARQQWALRARVPQLHGPVPHFQSTLRDADCSECLEAAPRARGQSSWSHTSFCCRPLFLSLFPGS